MASKSDYYETLGVSKGATDEDLKKAYRKMAKQYHPDANPGNADAEQKFKDISEAYSILSDSQKRAAYDQYGHAAFEGGGAGGFNGGVDFDINDIFESFFGGGGFGDIFGGGRRRNGPRRGRDVQTELQIKFEEAVFGVTKEISIPMADTCDTCKGTGAKPGTVAESCRHCNGRGTVTVEQQTIFQTIQTVRTCSVCKGEGKIVKTPCQTCNGSGKVKRNRALQVNIPKGIDSGQSIRLSGQGEQGEKGGPSGDLLVTIYIQPHKSLTRKNTNLYLDFPITFVQAALGVEVTIPTLYGDEVYTVKPGTQPGTTVSLKGKGVPNVHNNRSIGDLIVTLKVTIPTQLTDRQYELLKSFADETGEETNDEKKGIFNTINKKIKDAMK